MTQPSFNSTSPASRIVEALGRWQAGEEERAEVLNLLTQVPQDEGEIIREVITAWHSKGPEAARPLPSEGAESWRAELMASRARTWNYPHSAALLVSPNVLILTEGQHGFIFREGGVSILPVSTSSSLLLLAQTIVMAQTALDTREVGRLREQRIEATSTSLSEIEPVS